MIIRNVNWLFICRSLSPLVGIATQFMNEWMSSSDQNERQKNENDDGKILKHLCERELHFGRFEHIVANVPSKLGRCLQKANTMYMHCSFNKSAECNRIMFLIFHQLKTADLLNRISPSRSPFDRAQHEIRQSRIKTTGARN